MTLRMVRRFCWKRLASSILRSFSTVTTDEVILERIGNKGIVTLNRPKALNALSMTMIRKILNQMKAWKEDSSVKMIVVKGTGDKIFCAGGDARAVALAAKKEDPLTEEFFREEYRLNFLIGTIQIPYVSIIDGLTMGGGAGLSVHGHFRIATERTVFAMPEAAIGFFASVGGSHFLPRLQGKLGRYLALTSCRLTGHDVVKAGVATHFVNSDSIKTIEEDLLKIESPSLQKVDKLLCETQEQFPMKDWDLSFQLLLRKINTLFDGGSLNAIIENLKRDKSEWANQHLQTLFKMSPTSLKVIFHQLELGKNMSLQECLKMEYRISQRFVKNQDFLEGVRAFLIDKDNKPVWMPPTVEEVSDSVLKSYFAALPEDKELVF
ncbi:3-hydroxyisobutyryl-CoA hydrolase, mitochondrial-like isoform X2 [Tachypleus tridentatus]|uniref:3-hydroxyisobutyryl-CoA hydrolase, mitochondrial-like isoform X2 n=1 Tax=Tachypleus tridentatus TaxID=6853 RepID=UPI003FD4B12E